MYIDWANVLWFTAALIVNGWLTIQLYKWNNKRRDTKFLKALHVQHPDWTYTFYSVESSDKDALDKIERQLRDFL